MKILFTFLSILLLETGWLFAGSFDLVTLKISPVSTNATISQDVSGKITGYAERLDIVCGVSTSVPWVKMFASNELSGKTTTLFENVQIATNRSGNVIGTNCVSGKVLLNDEYIYLVATGATVGASSQTIKAFLTYEAK
jgi:hypothetical protein